jgi:hypothetical protein
MNNEITLTVTPELPAYFPDLDPKRQRMFGVHVSFAVKADPDRGDAEKDAAEKFQRLLGDFKPNFAVYRLKENAGGESIAKPADDVVNRPPVPEPKPIAPKPLMDWLTVQQQAAFLLNDDGSGVVDPTKHRNAAHILQGSIGWNAPIPHDSGFTYLVILEPKDSKAAINAKDVFLLPFLPTEIEDDEIAATAVDPDNVDGYITAGPVTLKTPRLQFAVRTTRPSRPSRPTQLPRMVFSNRPGPRTNTDFWKCSRLRVQHCSGACLRCSTWSRVIINP